MATKSAIPSHLKNAANGESADFSKDKHHGKSQSHVVSWDILSLFYLHCTKCTA